MKVKQRTNTVNNTPNKGGVRKAPLQTKDAVKTPAKKNAAVTKTPAKKTIAIAKNANNDDNEEEEEEIEEQIVAPKKVIANKAAAAVQKQLPAIKKQVKVVEEEEEQDEEEEEVEEEEENVDDEEEDEENNEEEDEQNNEEEDEENNEEEETADDEEHNKDEAENESAAKIEEETDDNDAPEEASAKNVVVTNKADEAKHKFSLEEPEESVPEENKVYIKNAPLKTKALMIFHTLKAFGLISNVHKKGEGENHEIIVAFVSKDSAINAMMFLPNFSLKSLGVLTLTSNTITADDVKELGEKAVVVRNIELNTPLEDVKAHFADCGTILYASYIPIQNPSYLPNKAGYMPQKALGYGKTAAIVYKTTDGAECAVEKHNSVVFNRHIWVTLKNTEIKFNPERTIQLNNTNNHTTFSVETLEKIFEDCGEIEYMELLCKKQFLATITFADAESVKKAMALNNTTVENLQINIHSAGNISNLTALGPEKTTVYVSNFKTGTTEEDLKKLFELVVKGIKSVKIFNTNACIEFDSVENYCQSFKLDEATLNGQKIYVEPYSSEKNKRLTGAKRNTNAGIPQNSPRKRKQSGGNDFNTPAKRPFNGPRNFSPQGGQNNFKPRNNFPGGQGGFQPRNNFPNRQNGFNNPRNNFPGNQNNFHPRTNQLGSGGPNHFPKKNFQQGSQNFYRGNNNNFQGNQGAPRKFNKPQGSGPKKPRPQNSI